MLLTAGRQILRQLTRGQLNCDIDDTFDRGYGEERAEVRLDGLLLCERHARMLEARDKIDLLSGIISCLDLCLRNVAFRRDANLVPLLRAEGAAAAAELNLDCREFEHLAT